MDQMLEMKQISKSFYDVEVLHHVDFSVEEGEVRALLGANGAGKSTLMKILCGVQPPTSGNIFLDGQEIQLRNPSAASAMGIAMVHQELSIVPTLTVLQNFFLGREIKRGGLLDDRAMRREYKEICQEFGFDIDPDILARNLPVAQQQMVEIMKILSRNARIIIMDEPTTSLTNEEKKNLYGLIKQLKQRNKTIIYISHILEEIFMLADNATILRNGDIVGTFDVKDLTADKISEYMTGKKIVSNRAVSHCEESEPPILTVEGLKNNKVNNVSFHVQPGEVVGLAGLVGAGRSEIVRALFGSDPKTGGKITIEGNPVTIKNPGDAISHGIGLIPENRKEEGLILSHPIYKNASMVLLRTLKSGPFLNENKEKDFAENAVERLSIKVNKITNSAGGLSGGNQQKVVVSKWLSNNFKILIFDEPTKGIDVSAKEDIFHIIEEFAAAGMGILFISSDLDEVLRISDRLLVIRNGMVIREMKNDNVTEQEIMKTILETKTGTVSDSER